MPPAPVLLLGDPRLRVRCAEVQEFGQASFMSACATLAATLAAFRRRHGFGRAISAPQIGVSLRLIAVNLGDGPFFVVNPVVTWKDDRLFSMWDDCMSFPDLLVHVSRHESITVRYVDQTGAEKTWERLPRAAAELMQHEIDHLDGMLAVDRAEGENPLVLRSVWEERRSEFRARVDYQIGE